MLGTGARIGEALAVDWEDIDLEQGTVAIQHTVLRLRGEGLVLRRTKSAAGERILELPRWTHYPRPLDDPTGWGCDHLGR